MTDTAVQTLKSVLDRADPNQIADALRQVKLGTILTPVSLDTGDLTGVEVNHIHLDPPALLVRSVRVVHTLTTDEPDIGEYLASDENATMSAASTANGPGVCKMDADGSKITFHNTVVRQAIIEYIPRPAVALTDVFVND